MNKATQLICKICRNPLPVGKTVCKCGAFHSKADFEEAVKVEEETIEY